MRGRAVERWLNELWYGDAPGAALLAPLELLFRTAVTVRNRAYDAGWRRAVRIPRPVVVVGNLTVGGTGKTPLVTWLARRLSGRGLRVGIASRGYGSAAREPRVVDRDTDWREVGDEPVLIARRTRCPTVVSRDRVAAARALVEQGVDVILCDDGLQHRRLARDCEIVVVDGARGLGNGRLLPAGPLREPAARLGRAAAIVVNGEPGARAAAVLESVHVPVLRMELVPDAVHAVNGGQTPRPLESFRGTAVHAVAGIGNPARFFAQLRARGLDVIEHPFPDHHPFTAEDLAFGDTLPVLMTEKDAVKCSAFADPRLWYVPVSVCFGDAQERELLEHVLCRINLSSGAKD